MKYTIISISVIVSLILILAIINYLYLPFECIINQKEGCIEKATITEHIGVIKRICSRYSEDDCIKILSILHSTSRDPYIPHISNEYCLNNKAAFCAFSAISYLSLNNLDAALKFSTSGCNQSEAVSCAILAGLELDKNNPDEALKVALKGCLIGSAAACAISGTILLEKGQEEEAIQFIKRCCELGGDECCE